MPMAGHRSGDHRDEDRGNRKLPHKEPIRNTKAPVLSEFFLEGAGIDRGVLQNSICRFLGAEATCRPSVYEGMPGYTIKAVRPFTPQMLEDLKERSREYAQEVELGRGRNEPVRGYEDSQTRKRAQLGDDMDYDQPQNPNLRNQYSSIPSSTTPGSLAHHSPDFEVPYPNTSFPSGANVYSSQPPFSGQPSYATSAFSGPRNGYPPEYYPISRDGPSGGPSYGSPYGVSNPSYGGPPGRVDNLQGYVFAPQGSTPRAFAGSHDYEPSHGGYGNPQGYAQQPMGGQSSQSPYGPQREPYGRPAPSDQYPSQSQRRR